MSVITSFVNEKCEVGEGFVSSTISIVNAYIAYNNGSTQGKLKLYAYIQSLEGVSKVRSEFYGLRLVPVLPEVEPAVAAAPATEPIAETAPSMTEYEMQCLKAKEKKMEMQAALEKEKLALEKEKMEKQEALEKEKMEKQAALEKEKMEKQAALEKEKLALEKEKLQTKIAIAAQKIESNEKVEMMKMQMKEKCFERSLSFQKEVNNQNRLLTAGFVNRTSDYIVVGTASNTHITYDSAIDNLDGLDYAEEVKTPLKQCFKDQSIEVRMYDESVENAIPLTSMINIHHFIISKLDSNELSEDIKSFIVEEYNKEENMTVNQIIEEIDVSTDDVKQYVEISKNEITRFKTIEDEARKYSRVHTGAYTRSLDENNKMYEGVARRSMLPTSDYITKENNPRVDNGQLVIDCYCCTTQLNMSDAHRSHIVAKQLGGSCDRSNVRLCCKSCNLSMGVMDLEVYKSTLSQ